VSVGDRPHYRYRQGVFSGQLHWLISAFDHHFCAAHPFLQTAWHPENRAHRLAYWTGEAVVARVALAEEHPHLSLLCL
jgi:hypothetical protein